MTSSTGGSARGRATGRLERSDGVRPEPPAARTARRGAAGLLALGVAAAVAVASLLTPGDRGLGSTLPLVPTPDPAVEEMAWSGSAEAPGVPELAALDRLTAVVGALGASVLGLALLTVVALLVGWGSLRRRELAVRGALGEGPVALRGRCAREMGARVLLRGLVPGVALGLGGGALLHLSWVRQGVPVGSPGAGAAVPAGGPDPLVWAGAALAVGAGVILIVLVVSVLPARWGSGGLATSLAAGGRVSADPWEGGLRRVVAVLQMAASLALLSAAGVLLEAVPRDRLAHAWTQGRPEGTETWLVPLEEAALPGGALSLGERQAALRRTLRSVPGIRAESIASVGAWRGSGVADVALADCGVCFHGPNLVPFAGAWVRHHAVGPGFFDLAGISVVDGRGLEAGDGPGASPVVVVNRTFARTGFEAAGAVGRRVRLGAGADDWYTVVGVVEEPGRVALGTGAEPPPAVYLSALQHPPGRAELLLRTDEALDPGASVRARAGGAGLRVSGPATTLRDARRAMGAPIRWTGGVVGLLALAAAVASLVGMERVTRVEVEARRRSLAVRQALGAGPGRIRGHLLGRAARASLLAALLAVPGAVALGALVRQVVGDVPVVRPGLLTTLAGLASAAALLASLGAVRDALGAPTARVLREE